MNTVIMERDLNQAIISALDTQERKNWGNRPVPLPYFLNYLNQCGVPINRAKFVINLLINAKLFTVTNEGLKLVR